MSQFVGDPENNNNNNDVSEVSTSTVSKEQVMQNINSIADNVAKAVNAADNDKDVDDAVNDVVPEVNATGESQMTEGSTNETMSTLRSSMFGIPEKTPLDILKQYIKDFYSGDYGASLSISITAEDITSYFTKLYDNLEKIQSVTTVNINEFSKLFSIERKAQHISERIANIEQLGKKRTFDQLAETEKTTKDLAITLLSELTSFIEKSINDSIVDIVSDSISTILNPIILILKDRSNSEKIVNSNDKDLNEKIRALNILLTATPRDMQQIISQITKVTERMETLLQQEKAEGGKSKRKTKKHHKKSKRNHKSKKSKTNKKAKKSKRKH